MIRPRITLLESSLPLSVSDNDNNNDESDDDDNDDAADDDDEKVARVAVV